MFFPAIFLPIARCRFLVSRNEIDRVKCAVLFSITMPLSRNLTEEYSWRFNCELRRCFCPALIREQRARHFRPFHPLRFLGRGKGIKERENWNPFGRVARVFTRQKRGGPWERDWREKCWQFAHEISWRVLSLFGIFARILILVFTTRNFEWKRCGLFCFD